MGLWGLYEYSTTQPIIWRLHWCSPFFWFYAIFENRHSKLIDAFFANRPLIKLFFFLTEMFTLMVTPYQPDLMSFHWSTACTWTPTFGIAQKSSIQDVSSTTKVKFANQNISCLSELVVVCVWVMYLHAWSFSYFSHPSCTPSTWACPKDNLCLAWRATLALPSLQNHSKWS